MKLVRVELENGVRATVSEALAKVAGLEPLDPEQHPAVDHRGKPVPDEAPAEKPDKNIGDKPVVIPPEVGPRDNNTDRS